MPADPEHPRPQLQRAGWFSCDGPWDFCLDRDATIQDPADVEFDSTITVPFAPETEASGIGAPGFIRRCWYRRTITLPAGAASDRWRVHFGAVDRVATVWIDGVLSARHEGGYTPFSVDVAGPATRSFEVVVRADDDPVDLGIARGKQAWTEEPFAIWYQRMTGIWQTVWCEPVPPAEIAGIIWQADPATLEVDLDISLRGDIPAGSRIGVELTHDGQALARDRYDLADVGSPRPATLRLKRTVSLAAGAVERAFELVWRPHNPAIIDATVTLLDSADRVLDEVASYTAIRSVGVENGRFTLNGKPYHLRLALDQGCWAGSGYTGPDVEALRRDVELAIAMGFNGVRKHQKIEDPRWLHQCDRLGLLVWEEMPSAYTFSPDGIAQIVREWTEVVARDRNHPCIVTWVPFNESWGVVDAAHDKAQRGAIEGLAALTRALDPTRPVSANDGWETAGGDIIGIHDYDQDPDRLRARYATGHDVEGMVAGFGPARRRLTADGSGIDGRAVLLTEMGGLTLAESTDGLFGYANTASPDELLERYRALCAAVRASTILSGFCWTQLVDTYQEANGLARMDRTPKVPLDMLRAATTGT